MIYLKFRFISLIKACTESELNISVFEQEITNQINSYVISYINQLTYTVTLIDSVLCNYCLMMVMHLVDY